MSDNLISRKELKEILSASKNFESLSDEEKLYIIHEKLSSLDDLYEAEKDLFLKEEYSLSNLQVEAKDKINEYTQRNDLVASYYEILRFFEDDEKHKDKVHIQELDAISSMLKRIISLIEESINMDEVVSKVIEHFTIDAMIQFSLYDSKKNTNITLNGTVLNIIKGEQEIEITEDDKIEKLKKVIIQNKDKLYDFSNHQEEENYDDECFGAIEGILFSVSSSTNDQELNKFYDNFKENVYTIVDSLMSSSNEKEDNAIRNKQQKILSEMINVSLEEAKANCQEIEGTDAICYLNPNGLSVVIDSNLNYLLTSYPVKELGVLVSAYKNLKPDTDIAQDSIVISESVEQKIDELNNDMIDEINHDYQADKSIGNVFDLSESLIVNSELDLFWKRVSADTLGYTMVKELEDNNILNMESLKKNFTSYSTFQTVCTTTELSSKNQRIVNIVSMLRQAPDKTLKTIYEVICDNLKIEKVFDGATDDSNFKYTISSNIYYNFEISFPFKTDTVVKNSESSFKIGDVNIMMAKCASLDKIEERANQWLENSAKTNSQTILKELDREYYLKGSQTKILEKQLEKNNRRRVYKFIYLNEAMVIFAYSSLNQDLSEIIDSAITSINILS